MLLWILLICPGISSGFLFFFKENPARSSRGVRLDELDLTTSEIIAPLQETETKLTKKCFEELGCVETTEEWFNILHRPLNLLPFDRDVVNTRFYLYTNNGSKPIQVTASNLTKVTLEDKDMKFIVHGFIDTGFSSWVVEMARALSPEFNVVAVDWGAGSLPLYTQATANTRLVGLELAYFINSLKDLDPKRVHIIGHSLGAHIAGYAGEKVTNLGRITGLDPAEPYFQHMPSFVRLDPSDAKFVDVIHTDGRTILLLGYGMSQPCGHVDFYPNDGKEQPGCQLTHVPKLLQQNGLVVQNGQAVLEAAQREVIACNHNRAIYYFLDSIRSRNCHYVGHACPSYSSYIKGKCYSCGEDGSLCAAMGLDADKYNKIGNNSLVRFFISTSESSPYCLHHYRVTLQLAFPLIAAEWVNGKVKINLRGSNNNTLAVDFSPEGNLRLDHGKNFSYFIESRENLGEIVEVQLTWRYDYSYYELMSTCWVFLCNRKLFVKKILVDDMDSMKRRSQFKFCGEEGTTYTGVASGSASSFRLCG